MSTSSSPGTTIKIVDPDTRQPVTVGQSGLLLAKGPGVMIGYKNDPEATATAIDKDGYFNTGDLGRVNPATGDVLITGREKDTIVLSNGENVAPQPIEDTIVGMSSLVEQCMLIGQDQKYLGALVVLSPSELSRQGIISEYLATDIEKAQMIVNGGMGGVASGGGIESMGIDEARAFLRSEAEKLTQRNDLTDVLIRDLEPSFEKWKPWERVRAFIVVLEPFTTKNGQLTLTQKIKRSMVVKMYQNEVNKQYEKKDKK